MGTVRWSTNAEAVTEKRLDFYAWNERLREFFRPPMITGIWWCDESTMISLPTFRSRSRKACPVVTVSHSAGKETTIQGKNRYCTKNLY